MATYKTPGVYVEEVSTLPPSVAEVSTAIPVFIGYTEKSGTLKGKSVRINTMLEFEQTFGKAFAAKFQVTVGSNGTGEESISVAKVSEANENASLLYYSLKLYFDNGGGVCYVISTGDFQATPAKADFEAALESLKKEDEPTLILLTDAVNLGKDEYYDLCKQALDQCAELGDRFLIADVIRTEKTADDKKTDGAAQKADDIQDFRDAIGTNNLRYGAAYTPYLQTLIPYQYAEDLVMLPANGTRSFTSYKQTDAIEISYSGKDTAAPSVKITISTPVVASSTKKTTTDKVAAASDTATLPDAEFKITGAALEISVPKEFKGSQLVAKWDEWSGKKNPVAGFAIKISGKGDAEIVAADATMPVLLAATEATLQSKQQSFTGLYNKIKAELTKQKVTLPPSAAIAGIYARTDRERGVWKAPANVSLNSVLGPALKINDKEQEDLNIDPQAGKSINAIRSFTGKGTLVWGARTLAGNDNEWRYVSVRRLFNLIEESTKKATAFAVFEPNDTTTWLKVKAMIDSYLYGLWQQGALAGATAEMAYYVNVGLGKTMTSQDVLEGRLIVDIGVAAVRPAEFIVIRFMHKLQQS